MKQSTKSMVLDSMQDLFNQGRPVTRERLAEMTGLTLTVVDDRVKALVNDGEAVRVDRGVYEPVARHAAPRIMSRTNLPGGLVKLEIGDEMLTLTPSECRTLGEMLAGTAALAMAVSAERQSVLMTAEMAREVKGLRKKVEALQAKLAASPQIGLLD